MGYGDPGDGVHSFGPIERMEAMSAERLGRDYIRANRPVVLTRAMEHWPAMRTWSFEHFRRLGEEVSVCLEEGNVVQDETRFHYEHLSQYLDRLLSSENGLRGPSPNGYLSALDVFTVFPEMRGDVDFSVFALNKMTSKVNARIGPAGTVTGYHTDWSDNMFAQISGRKLFCLIPPAQRWCMYPSAKFEEDTTCSSVDADAYDRTAYPSFARATPLRTVLSPGEMLFLPRGWWHYVRALDASISVNQFGRSLPEALVDEPVRLVLRCLHRLRLCGRRHCICHVVIDGRRVAKRTPTVRRAGRTTVGQT